MLCCVDFICEFSKKIADKQGNNHKIFKIRIDRTNKRPEGPSNG